MTVGERIAICCLGPPKTRAGLERAAWSRGFERFAQARGGAYRVDGLRGSIRAVVVGTPQELHRAIESAPRSPVRLLRWRGDRVIPLENALAGRGAGRRNPIGVVSEAPSEVPAALGALERGADLVIVVVRNEGDIDRLSELVDRPPSVALHWRTVPIAATRPAGLSERVLVDTTRILRPEEGLLVGSTARFLFAVASEATGSRFSRPRPFRVNAGAPHSYVLLADGTTRYLSELVPGDRVLVVAPGRPSSVARVGRLKIERRPMVMVEAVDGPFRPTVFVQEAETVRLLGRRGPRSVVALGRGDRVWGADLPRARHLGTAIEESVEER